MNVITSEIWTNEDGLVAMHVVTHKDSVVAGLHFRGELVSVETENHPNALAVLREELAARGLYPISSELITV